MDPQQQRAGAPPHGRPPPTAGDTSAILAVFLGFISILFVVLIPAWSSMTNNFNILHQVPEGHVGVYWRGGALLKTITDPGFHFKLPFITHYEPVQVTLQTDQGVS